ncbi:MAG TPA: aldolase [Methanocorpusculum sp.]|nr:aldolase [Methanocorpusculum sp.]HJK13534.1 aldolase [Methanocorpusculum sp.]HJK16173.1 aldolase [Methanocorpusculum sp.]HJK20095.1 aldolase [Methanocorpusculum sp.]HJK22866.1 aldolase [Methanocorpusculum sp.]
MTDQEIFSDLSRIGKRLFTEHLVGGNFGNMSARYADGYFITRTGSYLDADPAQVVLMPLNGRVTPGASSEWRVHTAIYNESEQHAAIVHAHPPHAVALSLLVENEILTIDSEGKMLAPSIAVVDGAPGTQELADAVAAGLSCANVVIARGHGTFAAGKDLDQAYLYTSLAEHCCKVLHYTKLYRQ